MVSAESTSHPFHPARRIQYAVRQPLPMVLAAHSGQWSVRPRMRRIVHATISQTNVTPVRTRTVPRTFT